MKSDGTSSHEKVGKGINDPFFPGKNALINENPHWHHDWLERIHARSHRHVEIAALFYFSDLTQHSNNACFGLIANEIAQGFKMSAGLRMTRTRGVMVCHARKCCKEQTQASADGVPCGRRDTYIAFFCRDDSDISLGRHLLHDIDRLTLDANGYSNIQADGRTTKKTRLRSERSRQTPHEGSTLHQSRHYRKPTPRPTDHAVRRPRAGTAQCPSERLTNERQTRTHATTTPFATVAVRYATVADWRLFQELVHPACPSHKQFNSSLM